MSYDYSLFKAPGPGPMESWSTTTPLTSLGQVDHVKAIFDGWFPAIRWDLSHETWFGRCDDPARYAEIQIAPDADGQVRFMTLRRTQRQEVEMLCDHLGIVAIDPQKMELYSNLTRSWSAAR